MGGTKIAAIAMGANDEVLIEHRIAAPRDRYNDTIAAVGAMVEELEEGIQARARVGIGMPGSVSPASGLVQNANSTWLNDRDFQSDIEARLGRQIRLANDANCFALSEAADGAAQGAYVVFGVIIGTGCGGGIVVDGRLVQGRHHISGEWGHTPLAWPNQDEFPGPSCWCGRRGCLETWISGTGLENDYQHSTGTHEDTETIVQLSAAGDPRAHQALMRHVNRLARGLAIVINIIDPDVIVLGGGLSNMSHLYEELPAIIAQYVFADSPCPDIRPPVHGDASGVRGAARLWDNTDD